MQVELNELKRVHTEEIRKLKQSFAAESEELQETISQMCQQISDLIKEKNHHGVKFIEILNVAKAKNKQVKTDNKRLTKMLEKVKAEYDKLATEHNHTLRDKERFEERVRELEQSDECNSKKIKQLTKKLYKVEADEDLINLDPYELHRKIRYYEAQIDANEKEILATKKELSELKNYLEVLGLTKTDLKEACVTGVIKTSNFNPTSFELKYHRGNSPAKGAKRPGKSVSSFKRQTEKKIASQFERGEELIKILNSSKTKIFQDNHLKSDTLDIDSLSISSESDSSTKHDIELLSIERSLKPMPRINDYPRSKPSSNIEILKHLSKSKEAKEEAEEDEESVASSCNDSFYMKSRKKNYEEKLERSKFCENIII